MSIILTSRSGPDGKLHLEIPVSQPGAEFEVEVTVRPKRKTMTPEEWRAWVLSMAGTWKGDFERMPQGEYEIREPLS
jgi:hypothetical protein